MYPFGPCTCRSPDRPQKYSDVLFTPDLVSLSFVFPSLSPGGGASGRGTKIRSAACREAGGKISRGRGAFGGLWQVKTSLVTAAAPNINFASEISDVRLMRNTVAAVFLAPRLARQEVSRSQPFLSKRPDIDTLVLGAWGCWEPSETSCRIS